MRMLPSFSTRMTLPVSATAMLTPVTPMSAARNFSRRALRARSVSSGILWPCRFSFSAKSVATSWRDLWMQGAMMCEGGSPASWMMNSPRSVSQTSAPAASRAGLSAISSVTMLLPLTMTRAFAAWAIPVMTARASAASAAQWTWVPAAVAVRSNSSSRSGRRESAFRRAARARAKCSSQPEKASREALRLLMK